jgi:DNA-binding PadR family transcriptional regulator
MSGYDIKRFLASLGWLVGSPSYGSIYPALHALLEDGLVSVEVFSALNKPPRKIYSITDAGRYALRKWIRKPVVANASLKAFLMRLILANNLTKPGLATHLEQRRAQVGTRHVALQRMIDELQEDADQGQRLALEYGVFIASAELAWLDEKLGQLSEELLLEEGEEGNITYEGDPLEEVSLE